MTENKVFFAKNDYDDHYEVWNVYPEEKCSYEDGNWGYLMTCEVFDNDGNELYSDHGETFELYAHAMSEMPYFGGVYMDKYTYLKTMLDEKLAELGLDRNIDEEKLF